MFSNAWSEQKHRVQQMAERLEQSRQNEADCRQQLTERSLDRFAQVETLFWIGVTGVLWIQRRQKTQKDERHNPLVGVALAGMAAHRWQRRTHEAAERVREMRSNAAAEQAGDGQEDTP